MENKDVEELKHELDDRYVRQDVCAERQQKVNEKFANADKRLFLFEERWKTISKLGWLIVSTTIGILITSILNLILG